MPSPSRSTLTMPSPAQSSLSHCDDHPPRHGRGLERHDVVEPARGDHHPAGVLAEMARQILDPRPERGEAANARQGRIAAGLGQMLRQELFRVLIAPVGDELGQPIAHVGREPERLPDLARRAPAAIRDHVGGHPGAEPPVAPVDVLNDRLAPLAARQIEIDVRPLPARLAQEPLEQELHADRIHRRDPERVADRAVGRGAPSLDQDVVGAAVLDDVPDDQEISREVEPADELELVRDLAARARRQGPLAVARAHAALGQLAQVPERRLPGRQRKFRESIAEVLQGEGEPQRQLSAVREGIGQIAEQLGHRAGALQRALAVRQEPAAGVIEIGLLADAREDVGERATLRAREERLVGRDQRHAGRARERHQPLEDLLLLAAVVALDFDEAARAPEERHQPVQDPARADVVAGRQPPRERAARAAGEAHEPRGARLEVVERQRGRPFRGPELHARDQAAKVLVSLAVFHQERQARAVGQGDLAADDRLHARLHGGASQPGRPVHAVAIHQRDGGHVEARRFGGERFGMLGAFEERERRLRVQLDEHGQS